MLITSPMAAAVTEDIGRILAFFTLEYALRTCTINLSRFCFFESCLVILIGFPVRFYLLLNSVLLPFYFLQLKFDMHCFDFRLLFFQELYIPINCCNLLL